MNTETTSYANTKKYDTETRNKISNLIRSEWKANSEKYPTAEEFGNYMEGVLRAHGIKNPMGGPLTARGVRFQVFQAGIRFVRGMRKGTKLGPRKGKALIQRRKPSIPTISSVNNFDEIKRILVNEGLSESQRVKLALAYIDIAA